MRFRLWGVPCSNTISADVVSLESSMQKAVCVYRGYSQRLSSDQSAVQLEEKAHSLSAHWPLMSREIPSSNKELRAVELWAIHRPVFIISHHLQQSRGWWGARQGLNWIFGDGRALKSSYLAEIWHNQLPQC